MAVSTALLYTFLVVMVAIIAVSIIGNLLVILAVLLCPSLRRRDNIPLASLSVSDVLFTALHPPMWMIAALNPEFRLPWGLCVLQSYTTPALWGVSLCHMGCIAVFRLFRVLYRYRFPAMISTKAVCIEVAMAWLVPLLCFIHLHLHPERDVLYDSKLKRCAAVQTNSTLSKTIAALVSLILPYFVGLACYLAICLALRKSKQTMLEHNRRTVAAPKIKLQSSGDAPSSTGQQPSIAFEKKGSIGGGSIMLTLNVNIRVTEDEVDCLPGMPEIESVHSTTSMSMCNWNKCLQDNGKALLQDKVEPPQSSDTSSGEDNTSPVSMHTSATSDKMPPSPGGGEEASKRTPSPSERRQLMEPDRASSGNKTRRMHGRKAYIYEERAFEGDLSATSHTNLNNTTIHDLTTSTSNDLPKKGAFNRVVRKIARKRVKSRLRLSSAEKEMSKMVAVVFMNYVICNLPMTVMAIAHNGDRVPEEAFLVGMLLWAGNAALNPIIYGLMNSRFKQGYKDIWNRFTSHLR